MVYCFILASTQVAPVTTTILQTTATTIPTTTPTTIAQFQTCIDDVFVNCNDPNICMSQFKDKCPLTCGMCGTFYVRSIE